MKWNHLPVEGGIYDQDPRLLDQFLVIFEARAEHQRQEHEKEQRQNRPKMGRGRR
jgi:hypothetical protein